MGIGSSRAAQALLLGAVLLLACPVVFGLRASVDVPSDLALEWARLLAAHPLPQDVEAVAAGEGPLIPDRITLERRRAVTPTGPMPAPAPGERVVEVLPIAPVGRLGGEPQELASADLARGVRVLSLDQIELPEIALGVDGRWPGEEGWQLQEQVVVRVEGENPGLREWLSSVEEIPVDSPVWIAAVGDVMPARGADAALLARGGIEKVFGDTLPLLRGTVLTAGDLEAVATKRAARTQTGFAFRFRPEAVTALRTAGFTWLGIANEHAFDFGPEGFLDTLSALATSGIATSGAGRDRAEASRSFELRAGSTQIRVLAVGAYAVQSSTAPSGKDAVALARAGAQKPGILWIDDLGSETALLDAESLNVVSVHGGTTGKNRPDEGERRAWRDLVDRGASVVLGSHPGVLQGMESYRGALIAYSLGSFLFPGASVAGGDESVILRVAVWRGKVRAVRAIPVRLAGTTVRLNKDPAALQRFLAQTRLLAGEAE